MLTSPTCRIMFTGIHTVVIMSVHSLPMLLNKSETGDYTQVSFSKKKRKKMQLDVEESTPAKNMIYLFHSRIAIGSCHHV